MTGTEALTRPHVFRAGTSSLPPLLLLHGTGGDERDLVPLGEHVAPGATLLSPRGSVLEGSMPRFFRRLREGVFDEDDLRYRAGELADFVDAASAEHEVPSGSWVALGFSNGANIAAALLTERTSTLAGAVLIAAMVPFADGLGVADLSGKKVLVVNGTADPMVPPGRTDLLVAQLRAAGATVVEHRHPGGHTVPASALPVITEFLRGF